MGCLEEENEPKKQKGITLMPQIAKNRSKGIEISLEFNKYGVPIGNESVQLKSYLGVVARHVPVRYKTWEVVPDELKEKLWVKVLVCIVIVL